MSVKMESVLIIKNSAINAFSYLNTLSRFHGKENKKL